MSLAAAQTESPAPTRRRSDVEANAFIANREVDGVPGSAKMHIETPDPAVSHPVLQGFLEDPEETERNLGRHAPGNVLVAEINPDVLLPRQLLTEPPYRGHHAQMQQPRRVQLA